MTVQQELMGVSFAARLAGFGDRTAIRTKNHSVSYAELARRVADTARSFGPDRRLIALEAENTLASVVVHLAALRSGNPLLILPTGGGTAAEALVEAYDPDIVVRASGGVAAPEVRREETRHELHRIWPSC